MKIRSFFQLHWLLIIALIGVDLYLRTRINSLANKNKEVNIEGMNILNRFNCERKVYENGESYDYNENAEKISKMIKNFEKITPEEDLKHLKLKNGGRFISKKLFCCFYYSYRKLILHFNFFFK